MKLNEIAKEIREVVSSRQKELELEFYEDEHIYHMKDMDGTVRNDFPSVSKVIKKFYKEFPTEQAALKKANGNLKRQQELIEEWAASGEYSTNLGSRVHYYLEKKVIDLNGKYKEVRQPIFECDLNQIVKSDSMIKAGEKYLKLMKERNGCLLDTEMVLGDPEIGYTGQPDKVWIIENKDKTDYGLLITDWKTNKPKNFQENDFTERMFSPFEKYPSTALGHYYIQLPLYGKLLLKMLKGSKFENLKLYGCIVVHLKENSDFDEYRVPKEVITTVLNMDMKNYL